MKVGFRSISVADKGHRLRWFRIRKLDGKVGLTGLTLRRHCTAFCVWSLSGMKVVAD